jgi:hypothetical protein
MRKTLAVLVTQMLALGVFAQTAEFGRASGGTIDAITKAPRQTSGSLSLSRSNGGTGYEGSLGGELVKDHLWFFAAASVLPQVQLTPANLKTIDAKMTAQPVDWTNVSATFRSPQQSTFSALGGSVPSSFLSLHTRSVLSNSTTLDFSFSRTNTR